MNTSNIKKYAPSARNAFIEAMTKQAAKYGITHNNVELAEKKGDLVLIGDRAFPVSIIQPRNALVELVAQLGFEQSIDKVAYSWFNRLCAIRYMELHDYLDHGRRVLSHPEHPTGYQLLEDCLEVDLPGLDIKRIRELKLDGTKDEELYRELLLAQCHALHSAMPFLFEPIDDASELLLPENLTKTDSLIHDLITDIPEQDWQNIEIIGWLYQFYISEKKDDVIGKVVKSEDIPAATQLFTPNWIVKYMVQNSLGAQWLATYPDSPLKGQMEYYIEPAEQTHEVNAQLAAITPSQLNPEELTLIDPASGSGHILVEAYELFKAIYLERGYRQRDVPQLILEKNLFGLDIDERAAQLTGFALMMKGRADDRRLFERGVKLNVMALVDSAGFDAEALVKGVELSNYGLTPGDFTELKRLFEHATTFGSLIQVPEGLAEKLPGLKQLSEATSQDLFVSEAFERLRPLVQQAVLLAAQYDAVVANPPYMGASKMAPELKAFCKTNFTNAKNDLFSAFIDRNRGLCRENGRVSMITMQSWMFLSSYEALRRSLLSDNAIVGMMHLGTRAFDSIGGDVVSTTSFILQKTNLQGHSGVFLRLIDGQNEQQKRECLRRCAIETAQPERHYASSEQFRGIPGTPIIYWASSRALAAFAFEAVSDHYVAKKGMAVGDNASFLRLWPEVAFDEIRIGACGPSDTGESTWYPCLNGGQYRKWSSNKEAVVHWKSNGEAPKNAITKRTGDHWSRYIISTDQFFKPGINWSDISTSSFSARAHDHGFAFTSITMAAFHETDDTAELLALANSSVGTYFLSLLSPSLHFGIGEFKKLPISPIGLGSAVKARTGKILEQSEADWNAYERSWDFQSLPILTASADPNPTLESSYTAWVTQNRDTIAEMKRLEEENNRLFIDAYGLQDELTPDVPIEQITLTVNPAYRYGGKLSDDEQWTRFRHDTMEELVSYAIGCMMGRYSLDAPGLVYAHSGNEGFDPSQYTTFPADDDGIVPITDREWFSDDAANRVEEFIAVAWGQAAIEKNFAFLADNLSPKKGEGPRDTLRRYLSDAFFKDHMQTYKKRPIYWLFSSGKQKAFQCLVYLHRYNEGTLARMRTEYVIPLTAKMATHVKKLENDKEASGSAAEVKRFEKEIAQLHKQQAELSDFDEKLRHYADHRISLDLDDGVKVNYGKFGDLLAEVKAIKGKDPA